MRYFVLCIAAGLLAVAPARAEEHPTWAFTGNALYGLADSDRQADDGAGFALGIGRYFGPRFSLDLEYDQYDFDLDEGNQVEIETLGLMGRYHFDVDGKWRPYLGIGIGDSDHDSPRGDGNNFIVQAAGGAHYTLGERVALRGELRWRLDNDNASGPQTADDYDDWLLSFGVRYAFGVAGRPAPAPQPEEPAAPRDSDGDGVADDRDRCPRTPAGAPVDADGCPLDSDQDGVPDYRDDCPQSAAGVSVGANGCERQLLIELPSVYFDFDRATLKPAAREKLAEVVGVLTENDVIRIAIEGHTDWTGTEAYNIGLSERRAKAVYDHLAGQGVSPSRMSWSGFGESRPVAPNDTAEGRARNRRVEIRIVD